MAQIIWLAIALLGGTAAILGSLMFLGSLLLWLIPAAKTPAAIVNPKGFESIPSWRNRLKLMAVSLAIALVGLGLLAIVPFPGK